ncbi:unnamed protein product [Cunninghamella echinulata]
MVKTKIIIVGSGTVGLSSAYTISQNKEYDILVFDQHSVPSPSASSTDINKAVRVDYGDKKLYMDLMLTKALPKWKEWNKEREALQLKPVYVNTGVLLLGYKDQLSYYETSSKELLEKSGYPIEVLSANQIKERFPAFSDAVDNGYNTATFNPIGGWSHSSEAIKHVYNKCLQQSNIQFILGNKEGCFEKFIFDQQGHGKQKIIGIITKDGMAHYADKVILATGAFTSGLLNKKGKDNDNQLNATGQVIFKFNPPKEYQIDRLPVWGGNLGVTGYYGFPSNEDGQMKIARHSDGFIFPRSDDQVSIPWFPEGTVPIDAVKHFRQFLSLFLPKINKLDIVETKLCWYSDSNDGNFLISYHPKYSNLVVASGDSGHLFKFFPVIGESVLDVLEGRKTEYTELWKWKDLEALNQNEGDPARNNEGIKILSNPNNKSENNSNRVRLATENELKANATFI